jgi:hypothetical protein
MLMQLPLGQPLYRPFMILFLALLIGLAAAIWGLYRQPTAPAELTTIDKLREMVRAALIVTLTSAFVIMSLEGKIGADIYANTFGIIIAFLFGQRTGERNGGKS